VSIKFIFVQNTLTAMEIEKVVIVVNQSANAPNHSQRKTTQFFAHSTVGENGVCWTIFYIFCHCSFGRGTRNLNWGIWQLKPFHTFTRRLFDIAFYILTINWKRKTSLFRFKLPMRGVSWTKTNICHKKELMQNEMSEYSHLRECIQKYLNPL